MPPSLPFSPRREKELLSDPGVIIVPRGPGWISLLVVALVLAGFGVWAWMTTDHAGDRITDAGGTSALSSADRYSVRRIAEAASDRRRAGESLLTGFTDGLPRDTDGVMEPLWPWAMAVVMPGDALSPASAGAWNAAQIVSHGRRLHLVLLTAFVFLTGLFAARQWRPGFAVASILPAAVFALLPAAGRFDASLLHFTLTFLCVLCGVRLFFHNAVSLHVLFGLLTGLAWLTDVTSLIVPLSWLLVSTVLWLGTMVSRHEQPDARWSGRAHFIGIVVVSLTWSAVCGARCAISSERWGAPWFSWVGRWMWQDGPVDAARRYPAAGEFEKLMPDDTRTPLGWFGKHSPDEAVTRLASGMGRFWSEFVNPAAGHEDVAFRHPLRGAVTGALAVVCLLAAANAALRRKRGHDLARLPSGSLPAAAFVITACLLFSVFAGWYAPVESGDRLVMVIAAPLLWGLASGAAALTTLAGMRGAPAWQVHAIEILTWMVCAATAAVFVMHTRS